MPEFIGNPVSSFIATIQASSPAVT